MRFTTTSMGWGMEMIEGWTFPDKYRIYEEDDKGFVTRELREAGVPECLIIVCLMWILDIYSDAVFIEKSYSN